MFITFEGVEGAGKSTQIRLLAERLRGAGDAHVLLTREPGDGPLGSRLRSLVLTPPDDVAIDGMAELFIMLADRAQHVAQAVRPALAGGSHVLCDRYVDSSVAYQGYGRGVDVAEIERLNALATGGLLPDKTILLDLDPAIGLGRQQDRNRMEAEALAFHERVRAGFLEIAERDAERFIVLDGALDVDALYQQIWSSISNSL
jgi:dTMP kinase